MPPRGTAAAVPPAAGETDRCSGCRHRATRFYPDFVAELQDGRLFVVEYKGADRWSNDDSREKRDVGAVWAAASDGRCVFAMATDAATAGAPVDAQLRAAIGA